MPKKKLTPEEQEQAFNDFNSSKECKPLVCKRYESLDSEDFYTFYILSVYKVCNLNFLGELWSQLNSQVKNPQNAGIEPLETGTNDISGKWQQFLDTWFELVCVMKVPHKAKKYEQTYFRTMFFPREEAIVIDGVKYEIPNHIRVDTWNSKLLIVNEIFEAIKTVEELEKENYIDLKKKLIGKLKEFDKQYVKHIKKTHPEVQEIITSAITPLLELLESNYNFHKLEELMKTKEDIPSFRYNALEDQFCQHLSIICKTLSDHGKLEDIYDIKRMLNLLKLDNWQDNVPMKFYLQPLKDSIKEMRAELLKMRERGPNRCKYFIEDNQPMHELIIKMVKNDVTAQWLMGDKLKNDQLCFLYDVIKIIYKSPLKNRLINKSKELIDLVIPKLACFRALLVIRDIRVQQIEEDKKAKKAGILTPAAEKEEVKKEEEDDDEDAEAREYRRQKLLDEEEFKKYGRKWIWQNYISENRKNDWLKVAENLRHINDHVIQDIQDQILILGFPKQKQTNRTAIKEEVDDLLINSNKVVNKDSKEEVTEVKKKRDFEMSLRPPYVWNFFETRIDQEEKVKLQNDFEEKDQEKTEADTEDEEPYLINHNAEPQRCYKFEEEVLHHNRVTEFIKDMESLTYNLKTHEEAKWKTLTDLCIEIFAK
jgi:hypothetical protein